VTEEVYFGKRQVTYEHAEADGEKEARTITYYRGNQAYTLAAKQDRSNTLLVADDLHDIERNPQFRALVNEMTGACEAELGKTSLQRADFVDFDLTGKEITVNVRNLLAFPEGHKILIRKMVDTCDEIIIAIGSSQESKTDKNPFSYEERKKMLEDAFPESGTFSIMPLADIGAKSKKEWTDYLARELEKNSLALPTHYFSGSKEDSEWYTDTGWKIVIIDRFTEGRGINATKIREELKSQIEHRRTKLKN